MVNDYSILCSCHDGGLAPVVATLNQNEKWEIFGISKVLGMGMAEYDKKLLDSEFEQVEAYNSMSGKSYIALCKKGKWGLMELSFDSKLYPFCKWKLNEDFIQFMKILMNYSHPKTSKGRPFPEIQICGNVPALTARSAYSLPSIALSYQ